jgi:hypothetical protein
LNRKLSTALKIFVRCAKNIPVAFKIHPLSRRLFMHFNEIFYRTSYFKPHPGPQSFPTPHTASRNSAKGPEKEKQGFFCPARLTKRRFSDIISF